MQVVEKKAQERAELVARQLESWVELKALLPRLFKWLRGAVSELSCLRKVADFATEFSSLESRMEVSLSHTYTPFSLCLSHTYIHTH